jgi:hypothetical protein
MEGCMDLISTSLHIQGPPPRYSTVPPRSVDRRRPSIPSAWSASRIPLPVQRASEIQVMSSPSPDRTQRGGDGLAPTATTHDIREIHVARRVSNPLPTDAKLLNESEVLAVTTQLHQIFTESHPDMPIQQARYYSRSLRIAMLPHITDSSGALPHLPAAGTVRGARSRSERLERRSGVDEVSFSDSVDDVAHRNGVLATTAILPRNGVLSTREVPTINYKTYIEEPIPQHMFAGLSLGAIEGSAGSVSRRRLSIDIPSNSHQLLSNGINNTIHLPSTPTHVDGEDTPGSVSLSIGSSDTTLVGSSSDEDLPVIQITLSPHSDDEWNEDDSTVEIQLFPNGPADSSDDDTRTSVPQKYA